jgi:integrase
LKLSPLLFVRPGELRLAISRVYEFAFSSLRSLKRPMSNNTVNAALRRLGYSHDEMTGHGFRTLASTLLNEQGWNPDLIELQHAHTGRNKVRAAYNRAQRLPERPKMMQREHQGGVRAAVCPALTLYGIAV